MLLEYASQYKNKKVGFVGLGISNLPVIKLFASAGAKCIVRDRKNPENFANYSELKDIGVEFISSDGYLKNIDEELLFLSPAVRPDIRELAEAKARGTKLTSETEEFFRMCPCRKIAVTGSDGKTTTTTLISLLLEKEGCRVHLGGNIGKNLLMSLDSVGKDDFAVAELSSFQLMKMDISPDIAVITNIAPNHLDWHKDMDEYVKAKKHIFSFQNKNGLLVLNSDDSRFDEFRKEAKGRVRTVSGTGDADVYFNEEGIFRNGKKIVSDSEIKLVGRHNRYNYSEAYAAVMDFVSEKTLVSVAREFSGVEHRIEFVREFENVKYYNSSIDSSPSRTKACLESFKEPVIVISGGYDKNIPYNSIGDLFKRKAKHAVLCGATAKKIADALDAAGYKDYEFANTFEEAVNAARRFSKPGDTVVLSPASASFDLFRNFEERGETFKNIVNGF